MRQGNNGRRPRGGRPNRRPGPLKAQTFDSNGPDVRIRGNAHQVYEKYLTLARDAWVGGDRVLGESYYQYAEHYYRIIHESTDPDSPGSHRPHFRDPRFDDRGWEGREWDAQGEEDGYPAQDGQVNPQGQGQPQGGQPQGQGGQSGGYQGQRPEGQRHEGQRHEGRRGERFDNRQGGQRYEGRRDEREGQRYEGQRHEGQRHEGQRHEGQRHEGQRHEGRRDEGQRFEGRREDRRDEPRREEVRRDEVRAEPAAEVERRPARQPERPDEDDRSGLERALGGRPPAVSAAEEPVEAVAEAPAEPVAAVAERAPRAAARPRLRRRAASEETSESGGSGRRPFPPRGEAEPGAAEGGEDKG